MNIATNTLSEEVQAVMSPRATCEIVLAMNQNAWMYKL